MLKVLCKLTKLFIVDIKNRIKLTGPIKIMKVIEKKIQTVKLDV